MTNPISMDVGTRATHPIRFTALGISMNSLYKFFVSSTNSSRNCVGSGGVLLVIVRMLFAFEAFEFYGELICYWRHRVETCYHMSSTMLRIALMAS